MLGLTSKIPGLSTIAFLYNFCKISSIYQKNKKEPLIRPGFIIEVAYRPNKITFWSPYLSFEAEEALSVSNSLIWTAKANPDVIGLRDTSLHVPCTWCKTHPQQQPCAFTLHRIPKGEVGAQPNDQQFRHTIRGLMLESLL